MKNYYAYREKIGISQIGQQPLPPVALVNPFKRGPNFNLSASMELTRRNPELAARLKALAEE